MEKEVQRVGGERLMADIEMPLMPVLADMEMTGILIDLSFLKEMGEQLGARMADIEKKVYEAVGKPFNINSTQQLSEILFTRLRLEPPDKNHKTASGHFSTLKGSGTGLLLFTASSLLLLVSLGSLIGHFSLLSAVAFVLGSGCMVVFVYKHRISVQAWVAEHDPHNDA